MRNLLVALNFQPMSFDLVELPEFSCIGLEVEDWLSRCSEWIPKLWSEFVRREYELHHLDLQGHWGLMSDTEIHLAPWGGPKGRYLAGCRVPLGTLPFRDWKVWTIPGSTWLRIPCMAVDIPEVLNRTKANIQNHPEWRLEGAVHESYPPGYTNNATDQLHLMLAVLPR